MESNRHRLEFEAIELRLRQGAALAADLAYIDSAIEQAQTASDVASLAEALLLRASFLFVRNDLDATVTTASQALELLRGLGLPLEIQAHVMIGRASLRRNVMFAVRSLAEAYALSTKLYGVAQPHVMLRYGEALGLSGSLNEGVALISAAEEAYEHRSDVHGRINALLRLCVMLQSTGNMAACLEYAAEAVRISHDGTNPKARLNALKFLAGSLTELGRLSEAFDIGRQALEIATHLNDAVAEADCLGTLGLTFFRTGDLSSALSLTQQAYNKYRHHGGYSNGEALCMAYAARIYAAAGDASQADTLLEQALAIATAAANAVLLRDVLTIKVSVLRTTGRETQAEETLNSIPSEYRSPSVVRTSTDVIERALSVYRTSSITHSLPSFANLVTRPLILPTQSRRTSPITNTALYVTLFGGFRLLRFGIEVPLDEWKRRKARDVFKFLVLRHRQSVPVDTIVEHLWSADANVDACLPTLQNSISIIRSILEPDLKPRQTSRYISHVDGSYVLDLGAEAHVDVVQFRASVTASRTCEHPPERRRLLEQATALYTGSLLPEDAFEEWTSFHRSDLHALCIEAYDALASVCFELNDRTAATAAMRAAAALDDGE